MVSLLKYPKHWVFEENAQGAAIIFMVSPVPQNYGVNVSVSFDKKPVYKQTHY
jgi:hypothetical protein